MDTCVRDLPATCPCTQFSKRSCPVHRNFWSKSGLCDIDSYSENDFDQKFGILTKLTKNFCNFENFENFQKMRQSLARQSLAKDCITKLPLSHQKTMSPTSPLP